MYSFAGWCCGFWSLLGVVCVYFWLFVFFIFGRLGFYDGWVFVVCLMFVVVVYRVLCT